MAKSPVAILYDENGNRVGVENNPIVQRSTRYASTPFGEARVASPYTLVDLINKYDISPLDYGTSVATGGTVTHVATQSAIRLTVTGSNGSSARLRTHSYFRYQAGKSQLAKLTVYHNDGGQTNQVRRWGYFDDDDGLFFELSGTTLQIVRRTSTSGSPVNNTTAQSVWNVDKLDGTGTSGVTLDVTKGNIYEVQFQWLGVGVARFFINGILVHEEPHANLLAVPYMKTGALPLSWEVVNTGASTGSSLTLICASVISEGGDDPPVYPFAAVNTADVSVTTTERPVLSIRPKATFNSIVNRMIIQPFLLGISTEGARLGYRVVINGSLTGASFTSVDTNSGAEYDQAATALTGGSTLFRGFLPNSNDSREIQVTDFVYRNQRGLRLQAFTSTPDVITVLAVNEAAGTTLVRASASWVELR